MASLRLAALISGGGTTLQNLYAVAEAGELPVTFAGVISSRPPADTNAAIFAATKARGVPIAVHRPRDFPTPAAFSEAIAETLDAWRAQLVVLAGFLVLWQIPERYRGRVLNIHPALLPRFGGRGMHGDRVHQAVLDAGERESGCTVHFADNEYDHGPIVLARRVPVMPGDDVAALRARVFAKECQAYPEAIREFAAGRVRLQGDRVRRKPDSPPNERDPQQ